MATVYEVSREENPSREGMTVTRTLLVEPYAERQNVIDVLLGGVYLFAGRIIRIPPHHDPWYPWCLCTDVKVTTVEQLVGTQAASGLLMLNARNYADTAQLVCTYQTPSATEPDAGLSGGSGGPGGSGGQGSDEQQEKDIATQSMDFSGKALTLPSAYWKWPGDNKLLHEESVAATKIVPNVDYALTRHLCTFVPTTAVTKLLGRVNFEPFLVKFFLWPPDTLRFDGLHVDQKTTNKGEQYFNVTYKFAIQPTYDKIETGDTTHVGWNRLFRPQTGRWERPECVGDPGRFVHLYDSQITQTIRGRTVTGFDLLFHPAAT